MRGERLVDNLRPCEAEKEKGSRNGGHREECLGEAGRDRRLEDLGKSWVKGELGDEGHDRDKRHRE